MKKTLLKYLGVAALAFAVSSTASAALINGAITFSGGATLDADDVGDATGVTGWVNAVVESRSGDFASYTLVGDSVSLVSPWSFNSGAIAAFWTVGGFTFDLTSSSVIFQGANAVVVEGTGILKGNGFQDTNGSWSFSTQDPDANGVFSFSASGASVPDGGTTAALLGAALVGLSLLARRRAA
jgi:hypothetical protein